MSACRNEDKERVILSYDEALKIIKDGEHVHTFRAGGITLVGCDWERNKLLETMKKYEHALELTGEVATSMKHGLALHDEHGYLFIETKDNEVKND